MPRATPGIFRKHGIDVEVDARPFAGFMSALPSRQVLVGTYAGLNAIEQMSEGKDLIVIGGGLTSCRTSGCEGLAAQEIIRSQGKKFGVWSRGAGATKALEALAIDGFKLDLNKDRADDRDRRSGAHGTVRQRRGRRHVQSEFAFHCCGVATG
jgi:ABC-type nitrate/sulfonate/bicarbonate transport system substrate-binding protein